MIRDWLKRAENLFLRRGFKSAEGEGATDEFCPRCHATLALQKGYDPNLKYWICKGCGEMLINPEIESDIVWFCDGCGAVMNEQEGFAEDAGTSRKVSLKMPGNGSVQNADLSIR